MNMLKILKNHNLEKLIKTDNLVYSTNFPNNKIIIIIMLWSQISNESSELMIYQKHLGQIFYIFSKF